MNILTYKKTYQTNASMNIINITEDMNDIVKGTQIDDGLCNIAVIGSTAGITTIEYEDGLIGDMEDYFERIIPSDMTYRHNERWHDGNGFSHIRSSILKTSQTFQIENGNLVLGVWQQIILIDFDNKKRNRKISIKVMGE